MRFIFELQLVRNMISTFFYFIIFFLGKPAKLYETSHPDWAPTKCMGYPANISTISRHERRLNRQKAKQTNATKEKPSILDTLMGLSSDDTNKTKRKAPTCASNNGGSILDSLLDSPVNTPQKNMSTTVRTCTNDDSGSILDSLLDSPVNTPQKNIYDSYDQVEEENLNISICVCAKNSSCQTEMTNQDIVMLQNEVNNQNETTLRLKKELMLLQVGTLEWYTNDEKVKFYTGLPNVKILQAVFNFLVNVIPCGKRSALSKFEKLNMTLMRLRLNLTITDLAYRFNVSASTVSTDILKVINIMFTRLRILIKWPDRVQLWKTTPMCFRKHFSTKTVVIIDCFEVFINKPKNLTARAQTFSSYKHHNTVKFLIGIAPQGVVSYISKAWGGRTSDKHLTENCNLLNNLLPGDVVLADRGFDIQETVALYSAEVKMPAFTKGKRQLSALDVEQTRRIASVRIHVERVIGNVRNKYKILQDILPLDYLIKKDANDFTTIDKITTVACALTNLCDSVIPYE